MMRDLGKKITIHIKLRYNVNNIYKFYKISIQRFMIQK